MGGTSFDVSLIRDGKWTYEREPIISRWRAMLPMIKVDSIGAVEERLPASTRKSKD